jgi:hypothetical protein
MHEYIDPLSVLEEIHVLFFAGLVRVGKDSLAKEMRRVVVPVFLDGLEIDELAEVNDQGIRVGESGVVVEFRHLGEYHRLELLLSDGVDFVQEIESFGSRRHVKIDLIAFEVFFHEHEGYCVAGLIGHSLDLDAPNIAEADRRETDGTGLLEIQEVLNNAREAEYVVTFKDFGDDDVGCLGQTDRAGHCLRRLEFESADVRPVSLQGNFSISLAHSPAESGSHRKKKSRSF